MGEWHRIVDASAKRLELAASLNLAVRYETEPCVWLADVLRQMARAADKADKDRRNRLVTFRFLGLRFTVSRDG